MQTFYRKEDGLRFRIDVPPGHPDARDPAIFPRFVSHCGCFRTTFFYGASAQKRMVAFYRPNVLDDDDWVRALTFAGPRGSERIVTVEGKSPALTVHFDGPAGRERKVMSLAANGDRTWWVGRAGEERQDFTEGKNGATSWYDRNGDLSHVLHDDGTQFVMLPFTEGQEVQVFQVQVPLSTFRNRARRIRQRAAKMMQEAASREQERRARVRARWQRAVRAQIKRNRANRIATALNRVETRRQEMTREAARAAKRGTPAPTSAAAGRSGPAPKTAWQDEAPSVSASAKRRGKKAIAREAIHARAAERQEAERVDDELTTEMQRKLQLARMLGDGRD